MQLKLFRKNWFPYCIEGKINENIYIMRFLLDSELIYIVLISLFSFVDKEKIEKFRISTIQEGEKLYILGNSIGSN